MVELRIEVVGGQSTEAPLVALLPDEATRLRALLASDLAEEGEASEPPLVRMRPRDLLVAGLTGGRVAVVAAMAGWAFQLLPEDALVVNLDRLVGTDRSNLETVLLIAGRCWLPRSSSRSPRPWSSTGASRPTGARIGS